MAGARSATGVVAPSDVDLVALPPTGRVVLRERRVRLGDASPGGRLRLDATARYLQDVANDDARGALEPEDVNPWVVRRTAIVVHHFPVYGEELELRTWCSGTGSRWAERRTAITGDQGGHVEAAAVWVHIDLATGRPKVLSAAFAGHYVESAQGRTVRARLVHDDPPAGAAVTRWPVRFADCDVLGHVNNAAYWNPVEEQLAHHRDVRAPLRAELEYRTPVELETVGLDGSVDLRTATSADGFAQWWCTGSTVHASAVVTRLATGDGGDGLARRAGGAVP